MVSVTPVTLEPFEANATVTTLTFPTRSTPAPATEPPAVALH